MRKTIVLLLIIILAAGCAPATPSGNDQPAPQETSVLTATPTSGDTTPSGYPAEVNTTPAAQNTVSSDYPMVVASPPSIQGYPGPGGVPALEARANVKVELIAQSDDPGNTAQVILKVKLVSSTPAEGSPDRFTPMIGQDIDLHANKEGLPSLSPGDTFTADVIYRGDETNTNITAENIQR